MHETELAEDLEALADGKGADGGETVAMLVRRSPSSARARRHFTPVDVGGLRGDVAVEAVAAEELPAGVGVLAARQGDRAAAGVAPFLELGLAQGAAKVEAPVLSVHGGRRGQEGEENKEPVRLHAVWTGFSLRQFRAAFCPRTSRRSGTGTPS